MQAAEQTRVQVIFTPALLAAIDAHRKYEHDDLPSRAEAIRRLCEQALAMKPRGRKAPRRNPR